MEGMSSSARVRRVDNDETEMIDAGLVEDWRGTIDALLVFVSLHSI
jgi:hypothetical protein